MNLTELSVTLKDRLHECNQEAQQPISDVQQSFQVVSNLLAAMQVLKNQVDTVQLTAKVGKVVVAVQVNRDEIWSQMGAALRRLNKRRQTLQDLINQQQVTRGPEPAQLGALVPQGRKLPPQIVQMIMQYRDYEGKDYWCLSKELCMSGQIDRTISYPIYSIVCPKVERFSSISDLRIHNSLLLQLHLIGVADITRVTELLKTGNDHNRIRCPTAICRCAESIRSFHGYNSNFSKVANAVYCQQRLKEAYQEQFTEWSDLQHQQVQVIHTLQSQAGDQVVLNSSVADIKTFKKHCALMIRFGNHGTPSLFIDNAGWLEHLHRYQVKVKFSYHEVMQFGCHHRGFTFGFGINTFNGECIDETGFRFRVFNERKKLPFYCSRLISNLPNNWIPQHIQERYLEVQTVKICRYCGEKFKNSHTKCKGQ